MAKPPEEPELNSWMVPVYAETPTAKGLEDYAVCKHCNQIRLHHVDGKCLFEATEFVVKRSPVKQR